ncbi:CHAP domain-containing protein [Clostridium botulinum]|uniref:CHAP domain-containing protein n=1 Tax=Clostridium botulinum TaxID=1491 RepID=UPI0013F889D3|nr:CHAP domain-containing protein [Clostridium botulinum]MBN3408011.1 CHAP domain-containing protein [Clostridium botulinum]MBY6872451.1 CHAP domain-containing protein [Clostridium botulinum]MBY6886425.1 CHAP domain-containing protein [Clostridium botulinum]MCC5424988.1 CHAP domain-containing protein [Clostridium botulinum]NFI45089.1 CHAP domain-containing protein [Clostridium botulinum]
MRKIYKGLIFLIIIIILFIVGKAFVSNKLHQMLLHKENSIGDVLDSYKEVNVFYNGNNYGENHGKSYSKDGYYYGYKWQCVEYVKRFYYKVKDHKMPDVYGNAKDFFDINTEQGHLNKRRGLIQYRNGENEKPKVDDLLVFTDTEFGHVVIVTEVGNDYIEVIQQNIGSSSRDKFTLKYKNKKYFIGGKRSPAGWLRKVNYN